MVKCWGTNLVNQCVWRPCHPRQMHFILFLTAPGGFPLSQPCRSSFIIFVLLTLWYLVYAMSVDQQIWHLTSVMRSSRHAMGSNTVAPLSLVFKAVHKNRAFHNARFTIPGNCRKSPFSRRFCPLTFNRDKVNSVSKCFGSKVLSCQKRNSLSAENESRFYSVKLYPSWIVSLLSPPPPPQTPAGVERNSSWRE